MEQAHFNRQLDRLKSQWPNAYGEERTARIWLTFQRLPAETFTRIVDRALDTCRGAPLADDFSRLEQDVRSVLSQQRSSGGSSGFLSVVQDAARANKCADPESVRAKVKHFENYVNGRIDKRVFDEGIEFFKRMDAGLCNQKPTGRDLATGERDE